MRHRAFVLKGLKEMKINGRPRKYFRKDGIFIFPYGLFVNKRYICGLCDVIVGTAFYQAVELVVEFEKEPQDLQELLKCRIKFKKTGTTVKKPVAEVI